MLERLGDVLYWPGVAIAVIVAAIPIIGIGFSGVSSKREDIFLAAIIIAFAAVPYGIGWSLRYILSGKK